MRAHPWDPVLTPGIRSAVIRQDLLRLAHALRRWLANRQVRRSSLARPVRLRTHAPTPKDHRRADDAKDLHQLP